MYLNSVRNLLIFCGLFFCAIAAKANPVACFNTNLGQFCIELFETRTPITATNFIDYISTDAYTNGIIHRSVPGFVIQGGGFKIVDTGNGKTVAPVSTFAPIVNEYKISNTRGTVAMAKLPGDPDSATSQWFVNLADNNQGQQNLDIQNGGFTVFGRILFDGMGVIDAIAKLPVTNLNLGFSFPEIPTINFDGSTVLVSNLVQINHVELINATGVFSDGVVSFAVDIGTSEALEVGLRLIQDSPDLVFELDPASVTVLQTKPEDIAAFSSASGILHIPSVIINSTSVVNNVQIQLTNAESYQFTLLSFDLPN